MEETNALGLAGGAGGVDERRELLALDPGDDIVDGARVLREMRGTAAISVGFTTPRFSTILGMRPSTASTEPDAMWPPMRTLPNE